MIPVVNELLGIVPPFGAAASTLLPSSNAWSSRRRFELPIASSDVACYNSVNWSSKFSVYFHQDGVKQLRNAEEAATQAHCVNIPA